MRHTGSNWVTIYSGPPWSAYAVESLLRDAGLLTLVPDENNRVLNPDLLAGGAFLLDVWVPSAEADSARSLISASPYAAA